MTVCVSVCAQPAREETEGESDEKERKQLSPQETSVLSPLKVTKKMKMVVCHVTLLDGNQFTCEVEVRLSAARVVNYSSVERK